VSLGRHGAAGDGHTDDTRAMRSAIRQVSKPRRKKHRSVPMLAVAIQNHSTLLSDADGARITKALARQLSEHVQTTWMLIPPALSYIGKATLPADASPLVLFDDADVADALGYHDETPEGLPYGRVFVKTILDNGGTILDGATAVSVTLSHELLEMVGDPTAAEWVDGPDGYDYARELGDPVESDAYDIDGVSVSNFVLPAWFDPHAPRGLRFDYLSKLGANFAMSSGGYMIRRTETGEVSQVFGSAFPEWKKTMKKHPASRTARRQR